MDAFADYFLSILDGFGGSWVCAYQNCHGVKFDGVRGNFVWFSFDGFVDGVNVWPSVFNTPEVAFDFNNHDSVVDAARVVLGNLGVL
jgi:hypothetical protein